MVPFTELYLVGAVVIVGCVLALIACCCTLNCRSRRRHRDPRRDHHQYSKLPSSGSAFDRRVAGGTDIGTSVGSSFADATSRHESGLSAHFGTRRAQKYAPETHTDVVVWPRRDTWGNDQYSSKNNALTVMPSSRFFAPRAAAAALTIVLPGLPTPAHPWDLVTSLIDRSIVLKRSDRADYLTYDLGTQAAFAPRYPDAVSDIQKTNQIWRVHRAGRTGDNDFYQLVSEKLVPSEGRLIYTTVQCGDIIDSGSADTFMAALNASEKRQRVTLTDDGDQMRLYHNTEPIISDDKPYYLQRNSAPGIPTLFCLITLPTAYWLGEPVEYARIATGVPVRLHANHGPGGIRRAASEIEKDGSNGALVLTVDVDKRGVATSDPYLRAVYGPTRSACRRATQVWRLMSTAEHKNSITGAYFVRNEATRTGVTRGAQTSPTTHAVTMECWRQPELVAQLTPSRADPAQEVYLSLNLLLAAVPTTSASADGTPTVVYEKACLTRATMGTNVHYSTEAPNASWTAVRA